MPLNLRRREYVDPAVQGALMRRLVLHWTAFTAVAGAIAVGLQWMQDPFATMSQTLARTWWSYGGILMLLVCLMPVFIYDSVKLSNRFTGPIHRLRGALRVIAQGGKPPLLVFREDDFWCELAADFNRMAERLEEAERAAKSANAASTAGEAPSEGPLSLAESLS